MNCIRCGELVEIGAKERDCENCGNPGLWKENELVFELFQRLKWQVILSPMGEPIALNYQAMETVFNWYGIPTDEKLELAEKVMLCWNEAMAMVSKIRKKNKPGF